MTLIVRPGYLAEGDPSFSNVSLLLHGDGTNGSTTIIDSSPTPKTVTANGNAQISTAESKFGGASIAFDGIGDWINFTVNSAFDFDTVNLTIESFIYPTSTGTRNLWSQRSSTSNGISFRFSSGKLNFFYDNAGSGNFSGATTLNLNVWSHVALTREGNLFKLWLNGILDGTSGTITASVTSNLAPRIGAGAQDGQEGFIGYMDDFRITKGIARYTANFTPPDAPFPDAQY
jgi:hypothetical protein